MSSDSCISQNLLRYAPFIHLKSIKVIYLFKVDLSSLGFLRLSLFALAIINTLLASIEPLLRAQASAPVDDSFWMIFLTIVAPILSLLFIVAIFVDYDMSRVCPADLQDSAQQRLLAISRIELLIIMLMLLYWVPFFMSPGR